ncbi:hypothetical protein [Paenibacillus sp. 481]|uniref:hypothetical protein n=1 Tax=Paenibacillus sp. 481 TaxID=2835869 RepID=UPI001E40FBE4|nr:hypothetical protein [Paenibacillus sp. 481]UHA75251.1 hypothetical protein KIK04_09700 [Paenibacillus sp. 481]
MKHFKVLLLALFVVVLAVPVQVSASAASTQQETALDNIQALYPYLTKEELTTEIGLAAKAANITVEEAAQQIYNELQASLEEESATIFATGEKGKGIYPLDGSAKGNIFYETASTVGIPHGHVGIYYDFNTLIESLPSSGVRKISRSAKKVDPGSSILAVNGLSDTAKSQAATWSNGRLGETYSYNFINNRNTSCYGDKNCSKLVWCAFEKTSNIDLDVNGGFGVYPKDIRDSDLVTRLKAY